MRLFSTSTSAYIRRRWPQRSFPRPEKALASGHERGRKRVGGLHRPVRQRRAALWHRSGSAERYLLHALPWQLLFPHRRERRGQDFDAEAALPRPATDARGDPHVRAGPHHPAAQGASRLPAAHRHGVPGFPADPAPDRVRQRGPSPAHFRHGGKRDQETGGRHAGMGGPVPMRARPRFQGASSSASLSPAR